MKFITALGFLATMAISVQAAPAPQDWEKGDGEGGQCVFLGSQCDVGDGPDVFFGCCDGTCVGDSEDAKQGICKDE